MKKTLLLLLILLFSCNNKEKEETKYNFTEIRSVNKSTEKVIKNNGDKSYWFVVWQDKKSNYKINTILSQPHNGFSMDEFKIEYGKNNFILNITEVSKETYLLNSN